MSPAQFTAEVTAETESEMQCPCIEAEMNMCAETELKINATPLKLNG